MNNSVDLVVEETEEGGIDITELFQTLLSRIFWIIGAVVLCAALAFGYTKFFMKPWYESTASLYVVSNNMQSSADITVANNLTQDCAVMIRRRPIMDKVLENLRAKGVQLPEKMTYAELASCVSVSLAADNSRLLDIRVTYADPAIAKAIADEVCAVAAVEIVKSVEADESRVSLNTFGEASLPQNAAGPSAVKNTLLAAAIGFLVSGGIIVLIYIFDDKIKNAEHVQRVLGVSALGMIPHQHKNGEHRYGAKGEAGHATKSK